MIQRIQSEYSNQDERSQSEVKFNMKQDFSTADQAKSRGLIYGMLFKDCFALCAFLPSFITGCSPLFTYLVFGEIITILSDYASGSEQTDLNKDEVLKKVVKFVLYMIIVTVGTSICKFFDSYLWIRVGSRISVGVRRQIFGSLMRYDVEFFDTNPIGNLLTVLGEDSAVIQECFGSTKGLQVQNLGQFVMGLILQFVYSWKLGLLMFVLFPIVIIIMLCFHPQISKNGKARFKYVAVSMTIAEETLSAIRTVRGFNREEKDMERFEKQTELGVGFEMKMFGFLSGMFFLVMIILWASVIGGLYWGSTFIDDNFTSGNLISCFGFSIFGSMGLVMLQNSIQAETRAVNAGARILALLEYKTKINFDGGRTIEDAKGRIEFSNVSFKYPTRKVLALDDVSFIVEPGQTAALVGHSGSGKSTCVQLLERFYDCQEGAILIDGVDIKEIDPHWLHQNVGLVSQEPTLFQMSVRDNVLYGVHGQEKSDDEVWAALEAANAKKFVQKMEKGLDQLTGDRGTTLSGGQRQRIAIARAVIKDPLIMITDEATSALDAASEKKVQQALDKLLSTRTGVVVAHRLTTIKNAHRIYVFEAGKIVEEGNHDSLIQAEGHYYKLVKRQLQKSDLATIEE